MGKLVFGMMQSLDGYVAGVAGGPGSDGYVAGLASGLELRHRLLATGRYRVEMTRSSDVKERASSCVASFQ